MAESIALFFIITLGLGSIINFCGWSKENLFEKIFITQGAGLLLIPVVGVIFNVCKIPIDYKNFLVVSLLIFIGQLSYQLMFARHRAEKQPFALQLKKCLCASDIAILCIFSATLSMYLKGSFSYEWFEDGDPWRYAAAIKYIALHKTYTAPFQFVELTQPYPQGYQILMAIVSQINHSLNWTVKFFNSLVISLSIIYFYCLAQRLLKNKTAGLLASAALASMPAWLSHFIFAINLSCVFVPLFFYLLITSEENKTWVPLAAVAFTSIWLTHFSSAVAITLLFVSYYITKVFCENNLNRPMLAIGACGFTFSLLFWIPTLAHFDKNAPGGVYLVMPFIKKIVFERAWTAGAICCALIAAVILAKEQWLIRTIQTIAAKIKTKHLKPKLFILITLLLLIFLLYPNKFMALRGSGSMAYDPNHFFLFQQRPNLIQNPYGIGPVAMAISIIAVCYCLITIKNLFTAANASRAIMLVLWIVTFLGVNGAHFSVNLLPFRMWAYFAFATALSIGFFYIDFIKRWVSVGVLRLCITALLIASFIPTWHMFKFNLNSTMWKESYVGTTQSQQVMAWVKNNLPKDSTVYIFGVSQIVPIVYDMISYEWDRDVQAYPDQDTQRSLEHNYQFLKSKGYDYVVLDETLVFSHKLSRTYSKIPKSELFKQTTLLRARRIRVSYEHDKFKLIKQFKDSGMIFKIL